MKSKSAEENRGGKNHLRPIVGGEAGRRNFGHADADKGPLREEHGRHQDVIDPVDRFDPKKDNSAKDNPES